MLFYSLIPKILRQQQNKRIKKDFTSQNPTLVFNGYKNVYISYIQSKYLLKLPKTKNILYFILFYFMTIKLWLYDLTKLKTWEATKKKLKTPN